MEQSTDAYVAEVEEDSIIRLHEKITALKQWRELEARYMTVEELLNIREKKTKAECVLDLLRDYGVVPEELKERIQAQKDLSVLTTWLKLAARVTSVEEFAEKMQD